MNRIRAWTGVLLIFLLGAASGIAGTSLFYRKRIQTARREPFPFSTEDLAHKLRSELSLNTEQSAELEKITSETRLEFRRFQEKTRPQAMEIMHHAGNRVRALLTPEQAVRFDALRKRALEKHQERLKSLKHPLRPPFTSPPPQSPPNPAPETVPR